MSWATGFIAELKQGHPITIRPHGSSMTGLVNDGDECRVIPMDDVTVLRVGSVVLCRVNAHHYLHKVTAIKPEGKAYSYQISNNKGRINGWISLKDIFGVVTVINAKIVYP